MFNKVKLDIGQYPVIEKVNFKQRLIEFNLPWSMLMSSDLYLRSTSLICTNIISWTR